MLTYEETKHLKPGVLLELAVGRDAVIIVDCAKRDLPLVELQNDKDYVIFLGIDETTFTKAVQVLHNKKIVSVTLRHLSLVERN